MESAGRTPLVRGAQRAEGTDFKRVIGRRGERDRHISPRKVSRREFGVFAWRHNWSEDRVYFQDDQGKLRSVPSQWTSLVSGDPVVVVGHGRAHFRVADLLKLAGLLTELRP